ncbi:GST N 3 domain containing protein [Asbolus verrucosus]|uniref:GST N 3 domain containing protein n=1 Tax=Asbolus verrucosus TaxID=1661398 RepID=A0A482VHM7_ASBVE|nr:GST N 3 domain containing protein [Asbolus verrucosus]
MAPKLYYAKMSPPCRASLLTIHALGIDVELVPINLAEQQHLTNAFLKLNPFHTVPTLEEDTFTIWDSHAINAYLVEKYGADDSLYPKDLAKRVVVDQRLHFDSGVLYARLKAILISIRQDGAKIVAKDKADSLIQGFTLLETLLEQNKFVAGDSLTIADFSIVSTVSSANVLVPLASNRFPQILEWLSRMQALPYYKKGNQDGLDIFASEIKSKVIVR